MTARGNDKDNDYGEDKISTRGRVITNNLLAQRTAELELQNLLVGLQGG
ncbi:MAG: hypothetical protein LBO62_01135 [Endomicrobium sp.]|jgi:hypothetical protein|nr:hypothetical protein [Endomicrobium sp.]